MRNLTGLNAGNNTEHVSPCYYSFNAVSLNSKCMHAYGANICVSYTTPCAVLKKLFLYNRQNFYF